MSSKDLLRFLSKPAKYRNQGYGAVILTNPNLSLRGDDPLRAIRGVIFAAKRTDISKPIRPSISRRRLYHPSEARRCFGLILADSKSRLYHLIRVSSPHFPSSPVTPNVTINHEATVELDSSNAFEGPEKLLEVWFAPAADSLPAGVNKNGLKVVHAETWKEMLDLVNCKVLSIVESERIDAYLLSESSMFVFPHKLILKTCGTTTLLLGLSRMLNIAVVDAGFPCGGNIYENTKALAIPYRVFYSRKNFLFPDKQRGPHRSWKNEVEFLDGMFSSGSAYMVGKMNGDHWYLYLTTPNTSLIPQMMQRNGRIATTETRTLNIPTHPAKSVSQDRLNDDETLEVLMTDLDPDNAKPFYLEHATKVALAEYSKKAQKAQDNVANFMGNFKGHFTPSISNDDIVDEMFSNEKETEFFPQITADTGLLTPPYDGFGGDEAAQGHTLGTLVSETCGLSKIYPASKYPNARIDAYLFSPCGFSANGVIPAADGSATNYFTVHVTPEPQCSYASFESNVPTRRTGRGTLTVVEEVVNIFKPGRFSVTLFEGRAEPTEEVCLMDLAEDNTVEVALTTKVRRQNMDKVEGYRRIDRIVHELDGYDLVFRYYEREGWEGGSPRLGEVAY